jgi:O-antigen/teichoic acid export membrane protein
MQYKLTQLKTHPNYSNLVQLGKLVSITGGSQIVIQIISFVCGIFIIRNFTIAEFAFYTIANTMLGAMNILADGGIISGVIAEGGKVWQDKNKLGSVIVTGLNLRKKFAIGSILIAGSLLIYLLIQNNANWYYALLILMSLIPVFYANLSDSMLEIAPKLHQDLKPLQKNQLLANFGRLILTIPAVLFLPFTPIAIFAAGIPRIIANIKLKKISDKFASTNQHENSDVKKNIIRMVKRILPGDIYNIFSVQITVWILSVVGSANAIAQVGALFRIGAVLALFNVLFNTIITPRFSRMEEDKKKLKANMIKIQFLLFGIGIVIVFFTWLLNSQIIWLLGINYANLENELVLAIIILYLNIVENVIYTMCRGRGWVLNPIINILINIVSISICAYTLNIGSLYGVLVLNIIVSAILVMMHSIYSLVVLNKLEN